MKKNILIIMFAFVLIPFGLLGEEKDWNLEAGCKVNYTTGSTDGNMSYKPYGKYHYYYDTFYLVAGFVYAIDYQITDSAGNYFQANYYNPELSFTIFPIEMFDLTLGYNYSSGEYSLRAHDFDGSLCWNIDSAFSLTLGGNLKYMGYTINSIEINSRKLSVNTELSWDVISSVSLSAQYDYIRQDYDTTGTSYTVNSVNVGLYSRMMDNVSLSTGFGAGYDSGDYFILSGNIGINSKPIEFIKLFAYYNMEYNLMNSSESDSDSSKGKNIFDPSDLSNRALFSVDSTRTSKTNPYIKSSLLGESFFAHNLTFGAAFIY